MVMHKIKPDEAGIVVNKKDIIAITAFRCERSGTLNIRMNELKRSSSLRHTQRIRTLYLLTKLTTKTYHIRRRRDNS